MDGNGSYSQEFISQLNNTPHSPVPKNKLILLIGSGVVLLILLFAVLGSALTSGKSKVGVYQVVSLTREIESLSTNYHKKLSSTSLRALNSSMIVYLANFNRDMTTYYTANVSKDQANKDKNTKYADLSNVAAVLDQAELINNVDRNYVIQINYQLTITLGKLEQLLKLAKNPALRQVIEQSLTDLTSVQEQFKNLTLD